MRVLVQRVTASSVTVDGVVVGQIERGLTVLVGIAATDTEAELDWMARKVLGLRVFTKQGQDRWDCSVEEVQGELLVVSQFTLYGDCRKGRRPSFDSAAPPAQAEPLFNRFVEKLRQSGLKVETGRFGAMMQVAIANDGPVTLWLTKEAPLDTSN
ncbi:MAG TPA: D-aminoacyl-tRNA deacylase [Stenomitos sp.]